MIKTAARLLPHRLVERLLAHRTFAAFAESNGLLYFGSVDARSDEHVPVRGFTMNARTSDDHYINGTVDDRSVTLLQRTDASRGAAPVTRVIASVRLDHPTPAVLLMSHAWPLDTYEAAFIGLVRSEHVALEYRTDANFLIYAKRTDIADLQTRFTDDVVTVMLRHPEYDYELADGCLNVYCHAGKPTVQALTSLLSQAVALSNAYEKDLR